MLYQGYTNLLRATAAKSLLFVVLFSTSLFAQTGQDELHGECGTVLMETDLVWLRALQQQPGFAEQAALERSGGPYYVRVKAHLVGRENYTAYYKIQSLLESFCRLNQQFEETGFYFFLDLPVNKIEDDRWYDQTFSDGSSMMMFNNVPGALNVYYVGSINNGTIAGYYSPGANGVAMANSASAPNGNTLAHEFGHFFSLPHTFYRWEWGTPSPSLQERVDGSNCLSAGDGFCDTPPDYAAYRWNCPSVGPFTDPAGVEFTVTDSFYMSYAGNSCLARFSAQQQAAMRANLNGPRSSLKGDITPYFPESYDSIRLLLPPDGAELVAPRGQRFRWSKVPGAVGYHVAISYTSIFTAIAEEYTTLDTSFSSLRLIPNRQFYWKVKPLFEGNLCEPYSAVSQFKTGESDSSPISGLGDPVDEWSFTLYPNPVLAGTDLNLDFPAGAHGDVKWQWFSADGKQDAAGQLHTIGYSTRIPAPELPGLYILQVMPEQAAPIQRRVVVE